MATKETAKKSPVVPILCGAVGVMAVALVAVVVATSKPQEPSEQQNNNGLRINYATGTVAVDEDDLNDAVEKLEDQGTIALSYKNDATSKDGQTFSCYIYNSVMNTRDEFFSIYADNGLTEELYLSGLLRPGTGFEEITLNRALEPGAHTVYVVYTQVEEADGEQVICGQVVVTMNFVVSK